MFELRYDGAWQWARIVPTVSEAYPAPGYRFRPAAAWTGENLLVFGGQRDGYPRNDVWEFRYGP